MGIFTIQSSYLERQVTVEVFLPRDYHLFPEKKYKLLLLNDGQDADALKFGRILDDLLFSRNIEPLVAFAVHTGERKQEYGVARQADYLKRGSKAGQYTTFLIQELLPYINSKFHVSPKKEDRVIAGFSLGGLSAFDIAWNHDSIFSKVGVFSGSFWWRSKALEKGYQPTDRIMHQIIRETTSKPSLNIWLQTSYHDEHADRDGDGIIDAIGDTVDLIIELKRKGFALGKEITFIDHTDGKHNLETMAALLPGFLKWAFPPSLH